MKSKDPNYAVKVEKAITEKYGEDTVQHPKKGWNDEKEKEYYRRIETALFDTIKKELNGDNPYGRKEDVHSRRFIYSDDSCIATCHFLIREDHMDARFYLRSSNVKDTVHYDLNFLKHLTAQVFRHFKCDRQGNYCKMEFTIGSGHVI